jgi:uncharacterized protein (DUF2141 family)
MDAIMGFISASGTGFAAPIAASVTSVLLWLALTAAQGPAELEVQVQGLRNMRGAVRLCLTRNPAHFPDCNRDPAAVKRSVNAGEAGSIRLAGMAPGVYALAVIHDENANGRLDKFMGIPREGFAFSRNPRIRMGPPRFEEVRFEVGVGRARQAVRMKYLL